MVIEYDLQSRLWNDQFSFWPPKTIRKYFTLLILKLKYVCTPKNLRSTFQTQNLNIWFTNLSRSIMKGFDCKPLYCKRHGEISKVLNDPTSRFNTVFPPNINWQFNVKLSFRLHIILYSLRIFTKNKNGFEFCHSIPCIITIS